VGRREREQTNGNRVMDVRRLAREDTGCGEAVKAASKGNPYLCIDTLAESGKDMQKQPRPPQVHGPPLHMR
jgi:hypothetical protein